MANVVKNGLLMLASLLVFLLIVELTIDKIVPLRNVGPSFSAFHPVYGKHLKPGFSATRKTPEFTMRITTNQFGFRGPEIDALPERPVLFLGDSFTMGYGVNDGEEYPAIIAEALAADPAFARVEVLNAAIGDSGQGRWIKLLDHLGPDLQPRLVVMQFLSNDFSDNRRNPMFRLSPDGVLTEFAPTPETGRSAQRIIEAVPGLDRTNLVGLLRQIRDGLGRMSAGPAEPASEPVVAAEQDQGDPELTLTLALTERAVTTARSNGWPVLAILVGIAEPRRGALASLMREHDATILVLPDRDEAADHYYDVDGHWNAAGQRAAAAALTPFIKSMLAQ